MLRPFKRLRARIMRGGAAVVAASVVMGVQSVAFAAAPAAEKKGGMPQLDFGNPLTISQVVWLAIIFLVLYLLLSRWALPQVGAVLEMRASRIAADLEAAKAAKTQADAAVAELTAATRDAQATAQAEINAAVTSAKDAAAAQAATLNARLEKQLTEAEVRINAARGAAMGALRSVATDTAAAVVTRLVGTAPADGAVQAAVDGALAARRA
jgi:F-type H+-transporting ATPase subunit b